MQVPPTSHPPTPTGLAAPLRGNLDPPHGSLFVVWKHDVSLDFWWESDMF